VSLELLKLLYKMMVHTIACL